MEDAKQQKNPDVLAVIDLTAPVKVEGEEVTKLTLRRPTGRDYRRMEALYPSAMVLEMAGFLANVPPSTIDELDGDDVKQIMGFVAPFLS